MGLFKSSKPPQPPIPNFALHLVHPADKVYTPNDTVSGHISLIPAAPIQPHAIEVSLWGRSTVWIRTSHSRHNSTTGSNSTSYHHFRDNVTLFNVTHNLFTNIQLLHPGQQYTFPFDIRFPQGTGVNRSGCYKNDADQPWTVFPHDLPPSFWAGDSEKWPDAPDYGKIEYGVSTRLICPGVGIAVRKGLEPIAGHAQIHFAPLNPNPQIGRPLAVLRFPNQFTLSSSTLTGQNASSIGFRQRISDRLSSDTPKLEFEAAVELPDVLTSGSEFQFRVTFAALHKSENVVQIPAILFKVLKLDLLDFTFVRAPRDYDASTMMDGHHYGSDDIVENGAYSGQEDTFFKERKTHLNTLPDAKVVMLEEVPSGEKKAMEQEDSCEFWFSARVPGFTPPMFQSFAITRQYRLKIKMGVEIGGKKFELEAESHVRELGSAPSG